MKLFLSLVEYMKELKRIEKEITDNMERGFNELNLKRSQCARVMYQEAHGCVTNAINETILNLGQQLVEDIKKEGCHND